MIVRLTLDDEEIETTPEHPFYTEERGWVDAAKLTVGEHVRQADGELGVVAVVRLEARTQRMYNLTVAVAHTFFVGDEQWLVHNTQCTIFDELARQDALALRAEARALADEANRRVVRQQGVPHLVVALGEFNGTRILTYNGNGTISTDVKESRSTDDCYSLSQVW